MAVAPFKNIYIKNAQGQLLGPYSLVVDAEGVLFDDGQDSVPLTAVLGTIEALRNAGVSESNSLANVIYQLLQNSGGGTGSLNKVVIGSTELTEDQLKKLLTLL